MTISLHMDNQSKEDYKLAMKRHLDIACRDDIEPFTFGEYHKTKVKLTPLKDKVAFFYALFSKSGRKFSCLIFLRL